MIQAIIFDFAGVIGADGYWAWLRKNVPNLEDKRHFFQEISEKVDKGTITNQEFVDLIAKETSILHEKIWPEIFQEIVINDNLLSYIKILKKHYKVGLLSNFTHVWLEEIFDKYGLHTYFDKMFISSKHGFIKPEDEAFQKILTMLGVTKNDAIFIDDRQGHVDASNKFGLKAFLYVDNDKLKQDLENYGVKI